VFLHVSGKEKRPDSKGAFRNLKSRKRQGRGQGGGAIVEGKGREGKGVRHIVSLLSKKIIEKSGPTLWEPLKLWGEASKIVILWGKSSET